MERGDRAGIERASRVVREWAVLGAALAALAAILGYGLHASRLAVEAQERARLQYQARLVEQRLGASLRALSDELAALRDDVPSLLSEGGGVRALSERLQLVVSLTSLVRSFVVVDARGIVVASNRKELLGGDWHEGERYRVMSSRPDAAMLYMSPPFMTPLGNWALSVGKVVLDRQGRFDGYILAVVDPDYWSLLLDSVRYAPDMSVGIVHGGGKVIFRIPAPKGEIGKDLAVDPDAAFAEHRRSGASATASWKPLVDGAGDALTVLQTIRAAAGPSDGFLVATFSREAAAMFAPWRREARDRGLLLAVVGASAAASLHLHQRRRAAATRLRSEREAEREAQEEVLRESEERLRLALDASRAGMWQWEVRTGANVWSEALWGLYGLAPGTPASYQAWRESILPEDRKAAEEAVAAAAGRGAEFEIEYRVGGRDGAPRWLLSRGRPLRGPGGDVCRYLGIVIDISDLKRASTAAQESRARLEAALAAMTDAVFISDAQGRLHLFNDAFASFHRFATQEACRQTLAEYPEILEVTFLDGTPAPVEQWPVPRALRGETATNVEYRLRRRDTGERWVGSYSIAPIRGEDEAVVGSVVVARDVTGRAQAEEERAALQSQLAQSQKLEGIGRLAGGIAHDFNNLLTVIVSSGVDAREAVRRGEPVDAEALEEIASAAHRAAELTRQLLAFARKQVVAPATLDLNEQVRSSQKLLGRVIGEDIRVVERLQPGLWPVRCDPGLLGQVLLNLAVNARDAMPGGGTLTVATRNVTVSPGEAWPDATIAPGDYVRLDVEDTGTGMTPDVMQHVFEPFFTTKGPGKGTGLGLSTVYGIVKQSEAHLGVRSAPGQGTCFEIFFPRRMDRVAAPMEAVSRIQGGGETILVLEDDPGVRGAAVKALRSGGYRVQVASTGEEAVALADTEGAALDLLLSDLVMPGLGGAEVARLVARRCPGVRILFMSGYTQDAFGRQGVLPENLDYLPKPFTPEALRARVREVLDRPRAPRETPEPGGAPRPTGP